MFKSISNWWNAKDREIERLRKQVSDANEAFGNTQTALFDMRATYHSLKEAHETLFRVNSLVEADKEATEKWAEDLQSNLQEALLELKEYTKRFPDRKQAGVLTPWMEIKVDGENELKGLKVSIDWNDAMVQHMKDKGHKWESENVMMQHFIAQLYEHVIILLENRVIEESDIAKNSEFE